MKLQEALRKGEVSLTENEKVVLQAMRDQGNMYEDSLMWRPFKGKAHLGYSLLAEDVKYAFDPQEVINSLVNKGVLEAEQLVDDTAYYIKYELEFDEDGWSILFD